MSLRTAERVAWIAGAVGLGLSMLGWALEPKVFAHAWLAALVVWVSWPLGALALLLTHTLTGGRWGDAARPQFVAGIGTLILLLPAVVPLLFTLRHLYPWLRAEEAAHLGNTFYLNPSFAAGRGVAYLIIWFGLGAWALRGARKGGPPTPVAGIGLILLALTVTFAAVDSTMSLDPHFKSSNYGMIAAAEGGLFALAIAVLGAALSDLPPPVLDDLGRLLQGLLVLWAYLDFVQLLIIWQSDLPHESPWYITRIAGGWGIVAGIIAAGHFILPFFALMSPRLRHSARGIGSLAVLLILMEIVRGWWIVLPESDLGFSWIDVAAMVAFAGLSTGLVLRGPGIRAASMQVSHG